MAERPETVFAPATGGSAAGVAVVRVSGPAARTAVAALTGSPPGPPRRAELRTLSEGGGERLDRGLVLWFPGPASYTGEDMAEFHVHGGRAVVTEVLDALGLVPGLRPAEPGEFTRRAFLNGKIDLTQAEAVADLVAGETRAQRRQALRQFEGALGSLYRRWTDDLLRALAWLEAAIDFADEDLPDHVAAEAVGTADRLRREMRTHLDDARRGERLREGLSIAIVGAPNVGKSSLLNCLAGREAAIVSSRAGTTRDVVEVRMDIDGLPVTVADTAGLRDSADEVEREGVRRARDRAADADLRLAVFDAELWPARDEATAAFVDAATIVVMNKADLREAADRKAGALWVSARTGSGVGELVAEIGRRLSTGDAPADAPVLTRARHRHAVAEAADALDRVAEGAAGGAGVELLAEDLRLAVRSLGRITGRVDVEDVLDIVFRDFCIGK